MGKLLQTDHIAFAKAVKKLGKRFHIEEYSNFQPYNFLGMRQNAATIDLTDVLPEDVAKQVQEAAEISMGTEISDTDIMNITHLCDQVNTNLYFI